MKNGIKTVFKKILIFLKKIIFFIFNPKLLLCLGLAWIVTNGWAYIVIGLGSYLDVGWMTTAATAYLAFLWIPTTPEKIVTIAIAMALLKILFPRDTKTLAVLKNMHEKAKDLLLRRRNKRKEKKKNKKALRETAENSEINENNVGSEASVNDDSPDEKAIVTEFNSEENLK